MHTTNRTQDLPSIVEARRAITERPRSLYYLVAYTKLLEGKKLVKALKRKNIDCYVEKADSFSFWPRMLYVHKIDREKALKIILRDYSNQVVGVYPKFSLQKGCVSPYEIKRLIPWKTEWMEESVSSESFKDLPSIGMKEKALMSPIVVVALKQIRYNQYGAFLTLLKNEIEALGDSDFKKTKASHSLRKSLLDEVETLVRMISLQQYEYLMPDLLKLKHDIEEKVVDWNAKPDRKGLLSWVGSSKPKQ